MRRIKLNNKKTIVVLSVAISILLWSYVMGDINPSTAKQLLGMSVEVIGQEEEDMVLTSDKDIKVDVKIFGRRNDIYQIRRDDISFKADLSGYEEGTHMVDIEMESSINEGSVDIDYTPKQVELTLERVISRSFKAELVTTGSFPTGISLDMIEFPDTEVSVTGVRSEVESVSRVVASLNAGDAKNDQTVVVQLMPLDKRGEVVEGVELSRSKLEVKVLSADIKTAKVEPKLLGEVSEGYEISKVEVTPEKIRFIGSESQAPAEVSTTDIDVSGLSESAEFEAEILLPEGAELAEGFSKKVKVKLTVVESSDEEETGESEKTLDYSFSEIALRNIPEGLEILNMDDMPQEFSVLIRGEAQAVEGIGKDDIELIVDFSEIAEPGDYSLPISYGEAPEGASIVGIVPESLEFKLGEKAD